MIRKLVLEMRPDLCHSRGPDISIMLDDILLDRLTVDRAMTWHIYKDITAGDHDLSIEMHNEDNTRFYDWGEDPNGEIRALHIDVIKFANDGKNLVPFDLSTDTLGDWTPLFVGDQSKGLIIDGWGLSMYKNAIANIILPVR